ncbi:hypothetical protein [Microbacterium oleivorans]|uniref:hypothetical protein n=1 Tax=Microbacterium oleivorans TaxID=273677 RepID=UPI0009D6D62B|nr:hypothetical protein [Microbacterium oleivorans]
MTPTAAEPAAAATLLGRTLRRVFVAAQRVRSPRPIHPRGLTLGGNVFWSHRDGTSGIHWIDDPAPGDRTEAVARFSRSLGLPDHLPDILGLALHVKTDTGHADIELASTGSGVPLRFVLIPRWRPSRGVLTTLVPHRGDNGPVLLRARPLRPSLPSGLGDIDEESRSASWQLTLSYATPGGAWHPFALLSLDSRDDAADIRFDAGRHIIPGARTYPWVRAIRQPSYDAVQRHNR